MIKKAVTLKDVAEKSGLSLRTVKKVFSGDLSVKPENRERILEVASELEYSKNTMASILASNRQYHVVILIENFKYFFPEMREGFIQSAEQLREYKIGISFRVLEDRSLLTARRVLEELAEEDEVDAVILHASSMTGLDEQINRLMEKGKPVFTVGADAPYSKRVCFVGPKAYESGRIGGQLMANYIGKQGSVCIVNHMAEQMQTSERTRGFLAVMEESYPEVMVHRVIVEDMEQYYDTVKGVVEKNDLVGLLCTDAACLIAGYVLRDLKRSEIALVGYDLTPEVEELMEQEYITLVLSQNPKRQAMVALEKMCDYLILGKDVPQNIFTPVDIITSEWLRYRNE